MTKAEQQAAIDTLDEMSIPLSNAFQRVNETAGAGSMNSYQIAALNALGAAMDYVRSMSTEEE